MGKYFALLLRDQSKELSSSKFSFWRIVILGLILLFALGGQLYRISDPYWLYLETGFQEIVAGRHLDPGLSMTYGLSTLNNLEAAPTYHPTHPPLLQLSIAGLYWLLGKSEAAARLIPLLSFAAMMFGLWIMTQKLSPDARIGVLAAAVVTPISFHAGRIVNFETPVLAFIVWSMVCVERLSCSESRGWRLLLVFLGIGGTLIDWPYPLFVMCLLLISWLRLDRGEHYFRVICVLWLCSMATASLYVLVLYCAGLLEPMTQHAQLQAGVLAEGSGYKIPPVMADSQWWGLIGWRLAKYVTPVFCATMVIWFLDGLIKFRFRQMLHHWSLVLLLFCCSYFFIFSRASYNHLWSLIYFTPLVCLSFALVMDRLKPWISYLLLASAIMFAAPVTFELRNRTPMRDSVKVGQVIASATDCLSAFERKAMDGPLLYVNRVDPLPYYARCETAFSHLSVKVSKLHKFLILHRPEFVVLSGYKKRSSVTLIPEYSPELFKRLQKSYSCVYRQTNIEMWESLWSPHLSIMGMTKSRNDSEPELLLVDDLNESHIGMRAKPADSPLIYDLSSIPKPGRRWLHGWIIARSKPYLDPIVIDVKNQAGDSLGRIEAVPQKERSRWQEFWLPLGVLPDQLVLSWQRGSLLLGDMRLMNESLWAEDLTPVLASEIKRLQGDNAYRETLMVQVSRQREPMVMQHPGFGVDSVDLPPVRMGLNKELVITYGLSPEVRNKSDGATFRVYLRDHALGRRDLLFEDFLCPKDSPDDPTWKTRRISMRENSRHVLVFTFEVDSGLSGNAASDHALWREIKIVDPE